MAILNCKNEGRIHNENRGHMEIGIGLGVNRGRRAKRRSIRPEPYGFSHVYPGRQDVRDDQLQWPKATHCQRFVPGIT